MPSASFNEKKANSINGMSGRKVSVEGSIYNLRPYLGNTVYFVKIFTYGYTYYRNLHLFRFVKRADEHIYILIINLQKKTEKTFIGILYSTFRQPQKLKGRKKTTKSV